MSATRAPTATELAVLMDRLPCVVVPCVICGGRGRYPAVRGFWAACTTCNGLGEQPPGATRNLLACQDRRERPS